VRGVKNASEGPVRRTASLEGVVSMVGSMKKCVCSVVGSACFVAGVALLGAGCAAKSTPSPAPPAVTNPTPVAPTADPLVVPPPATTASATAPAAAASPEKPYTKESPGPWDAAIAAKHSPEITYVKAGKGLKVTVKVDNHPMDAQKPHYIMWIRLEDAQGNVLGKKDFVATDPAPIATFELGSIPSELHAVEQCNIHGVWASSVPVAMR
jgi:desulfoferrodoxin-like iron-binding protein